MKKTVLMSFLAIVMAVIVSSCGKKALFTPDDFKTEAIKEVKDVTESESGFEATYIPNVADNVEEFDAWCEAVYNKCKSIADEGKIREFDTDLTEYKHHNDCLYFMFSYTFKHEGKDVKVRINNTDTHYKIKVEAAV